MERTGVASLLVLLMLSAPLTGCFADSENMPGEGDLEVDISSMEGGFFQDMVLSASSSMSIFVPYLIIEDGNLSLIHI